MDEQKRPRARQKKVVDSGKGVEKKGSGLGTGPVGNAGVFGNRESQRPAGGQSTPRRTGNPFGGSRPAGSQETQQSGSPFGGSRPTGSQGAQQRPSANPFAAPHSSGSRPADSQGAQQRPASNPFAAPHSSGSRPAGSQGTQPSGSPFGSARQTTQRSSGGSQRSGGGGGKLLPLIVVLALLLGGGKLSGLFGGNESSTLPTGTTTGSQSTGAGTGSGMSDLLGGLLGGSDSSTGTSQDPLSSLLGGGTGSETSSVSQDSASSLLGGSSTSGGLSNLLSAFMGSSGSSVYDYTGASQPAASGSGMDFFSLLSGGMSGTQSSGASSGSVLSGASSGGQVDNTVASGARAKRTQILGKKKDTVTVLVYLCGTDLESRNGMGTADLKEMASAKVGDQVNLIVYTGGCRQWRNNVVSSRVNQIYQIKDGSLYCLEKDMGNAAMSRPATLTEFIRYGAEHFPANRMELILWDHGGGSVTGYCYDEKYSSGGAMSLAGIRTSLADAGVTFDFIGFDACLMGTVENGLMLEQFADYLIASEETEPGVGWYYTNWLTKLSENPSMPTVEIGKMIADDFVAVCNQKCRGQATTLSVVDLAELKATVPAELKAFSQGANQLIQKQEYAKVSRARSTAREFGQSSAIDQIDLVHFARNLGTSEGKSLAKAIEDAVKYNRTGGGISNANGLSIYFPYRKASKVRQMVSTYQAIGMDEEYARCIQEFASMEISGQAAGGTPISSFGQVNGLGSPYGGQSSLLNSLLGGGSYSGGYTSSQGDMTDLLGGLFGGGSGSGDLFDLFGGRSLTAETAAQYISEHHLDPAALVWKNGRISLSEGQWNEVMDLALNVFVDDGAGYINLGLDNLYTLDGNDLLAEFDGTWISIDRQPVAYYYLGTVENGEDEYLITGYVPALLNGERVNLRLNFDHLRPDGYIAGAEPVYPGGETELQAKNLIQIGAGDQLQFLCDYYDYKGNYQDTYRLGDPITLGDSVEIANTPIGKKTLATWRLTDIYQQHYWTPSI